MRPRISSVPAIPTASCLEAPDIGRTRDPHLWPVQSWRTLRRDTYRAALRSGALRAGICVEEPLHRDRPTVVFIHGAVGAPSHFAALAAALRDDVNRAAFLWDDTARLGQSAELLRTELLRMPACVTVVAHSMGMLLPAYVGATDPLGLVGRLAAVYVNPLVGGSRYAGDFRALRWLRLGPVLQRMFFPPNVLDLAPESEFQQTICGHAGAPSSFARQTVILFTERHGKEPGVPPTRVPRYFGRTRGELLERFGTVVDFPLSNGHNAPLFQPDLLIPILEKLLDRPLAAPRARREPIRSPDAPQHAPTER